MVLAMLTVSEQSISILRGPDCQWLRQGAVDAAREMTVLVVPHGAY